MHFEVSFGKYSHLEQELDHTIYNRLMFLYILVSYCLLGIYCIVKLLISRKHENKGQYSDTLERLVIIFSTLLTYNCV